MKVLVTGATGFVGKQLLLLLREKGHQTVVLTRDPEKAGVRLPIHTEVHRWLPTQLEPPRAAFNGVDAVIHLLGENVAGGLWTDSRKNRILGSRVFSTRNLYRALKNLEVKPKVVVSASAVGIYGDGGEESLDESKANGTGFLADVCRSWEQEVFRIESLGIRTVALRIGVVLGKEGGAMKLMLPAFRLGLGGPLGNGKQWLPWVHVRDVAGMAVHAIETDALSGPVNTVAPHQVTNLEFSKTLGKELKRPALIPVPAFAMKLALNDLAKMVLSSQKVSAEKAKASGYQFLYPKLNLALRQVVNHFDHEFLMEQWVPKPLDEVFPFFSDAKNLEHLTPEFLNFKFLRISTESVREGTTIDYSLKLHGIPFEWQSKIIGWEPNKKFSDTQTKGPYAHWFHTHEFYEQDGGTILRDRVMYRLPFDVFTDLPVHPFIRKDLETIFLYRRKQAEKLFGK